MVLLGTESAAVGFCQRFTTAALTGIQYQHRFVAREETAGERLGQSWVGGVYVAQFKAYNRGTNH